MSDVQVNYGPGPVESPSRKVVKDANRIVIATDERGRKLGIKRMTSGLASFRLTRILGPDAGNRSLLAQAMMYVTVISIDGDPVPFPRTELQLEALIDRLDLAGFHLIQKVQQEEFGIGQTREEQDEEAKN
jgi:hypothetical protein